MALPVMDSDPTVPAARTDADPLTPESTVHEAWEQLAATGASAVVLVRDDRPVALASRAALGLALTTGDGGAPVGSVADYVAVPVDRTVDALTTLHTFTAAAWHWLRCDRGR